MNKPKTLSAIGWREWVSLPELGIERIKAKIDTGARTSTLHAYDLRQIEIEGESWIDFRVHPVQRDAEVFVECRAPLCGERWVRSSTGKATLRPVIRTRIRLGSRLWPIQVTLVRRDVMGFRMLLGRRAIRRKFLVDPGRSFLSGSPDPARSKAAIRGPKEQT